MDFSAVEGPVRKILTITWSQHGCISIFNLYNTFQLLKRDAVIIYCNF